MDGGNCKWAEFREHGGAGSSGDYYCIVQDSRDIIIGDLTEKRCTFPDYHVCPFYLEREKEIKNKHGR